MYTRQWDFLKNKFESGQLAHAYLLSGSVQSDKVSFAKDFIKLINCLSIQTLKGKDFDDKCQNCLMIERGNFPDLITIRSADSQSSSKNEKDTLTIEVGQIRQVQNFLSLKSYSGGFKSIIIEDAERMTTEAQDCFLKTLEEPKGETIIFLNSSKPSLLSSTILSRCQEIKFLYEKEYEISKEESVMLQGLLSIMDLDLAEKFSYVKKLDFQGQNLLKILEILQLYFRNLLLLRVGINVSSKISNISLNNYSVSEIKKIVRLIDNVIYKVSFANSSPKLGLEIVLMEI